MIKVVFSTERYNFGEIIMNNDVQYGAVSSVSELGNLVRAHRKHRKFTLEKISGLGNVSTRFLSEFERGKETAEIGKILQALRTLGLELVIQPRKGVLGRLNNPPELTSTQSKGGK